jgi:hypothetical protein
MREQTRRELETLRGATWFRAVGIPDVEEARVLSSWAEASRACERQQYEDLKLEARNLFTERLAERDPERFKEWNIAVRELRPVAKELVKAKFSVVEGLDERVLSTLTATADWDILNVLMEAEYSDVAEPAFYTGLAYWYVAGHFPCGWDGPLPGGKVVVY